MGLYKVRRQAIIDILRQMGLDVLARFQHLQGNPATALWILRLLDGAMKRFRTVDDFISNNTLRSRTNRACLLTPSQARPKTCASGA